MLLCAAVFGLAVVVVVLVRVNHRPMLYEVSLLAVRTRDLEATVHDHEAEMHAVVHDFSGLPA